MRHIRFGFVPLAALLVALAVIGFAAAQTPSPTTTPTSGKSMHPMLPELQGVPKAEMFEHFRGAQFSIADQQGVVVTYVMTPGTVATLSATALSVTPNGGTATMTFSITGNTVIHATPARGSVQALAPGDKVMVMSRQGSDEAVMIGKHPVAGMHRFRHGGMGQPMMQGT